jgi:FixJ family two-component response regulator
VPLNALRNSEPERAEPQTRDESESGVAIAVVDDDAAVLDSTRVLLEALDFEVHAYVNAADFLAANPKIACVIADYHMPGMNGLDLAAELRSRGNTIPVIMITAMSDPQIETRAAALGIKAVLKKPLGKALAAAVKSELG